MWLCLSQMLVFFTSLHNWQVLPFLQTTLITSTSLNISTYSRIAVSFLIIPVFWWHWNLFYNSQYFGSYSTFMPQKFQLLCAYWSLHHEQLHILIFLLPLLLYAFLQPILLQPALFLCKLFSWVLWPDKPLFWSSLDMTVKSLQCNIFLYFCSIPLFGILWILLLFWLVAFLIPNSSWI